MSCLNHQACPFDEEYFLRGEESGKSNYTNYRWLGDVTLQYAIFLVRHLGLNRYSSVLDFGCARGYLVKAMGMQGIRAHGYDISQVIEQRSEGAVRFKVASLYPLLYRLERRGWIAGQWVEKEGQRRRRYYRLTRDGRRVLSEQRRGWQRFVAAINRITETGHA